MAPLEINVTGVGTAVHRAERAILTLQATSQQMPTASEASATVTTTANTLRDAIMPYCPQDESTGQTKPNAAISHYTMSSLSTNSHTQYYADTKTNEIKYTAHAEFSIKFSDFGVLDKLATQFSAMENVKIQKIEWRLTDKTLEEMRSVARRRAAKDAIQRAKDYAEVFVGEGKQEAVRAVEVREIGRYGQATRPGLHELKGQRPFVGRERPEMKFEFEDVSVSVNVDGKFIVES